MGKPGHLALLTVVVWLRAARAFGTTLNPYFLTTALAILLAFSAGCMSGATLSGFRRGQLVENRSSASQVPGPTVGPCLVSVTIDGVSGEKQYECGLWPFVPFAPMTCRWSWLEETKAVYGESGLCSAEENKDSVSLFVHADVRYTFVDKGSMGGLVFLLGIPFLYSSETIAVTTTLRLASGETLGSVEKSETLDTWAHLLMPVLYPFRGSYGAALRQMYRDILKVTIAEAHANGIL